MKSAPKNKTRAASQLSLCGGSEGFLVQVRKLKEGEHGSCAQIPDESKKFSL